MMTDRKRSSMVATFVRKCDTSETPPLFEKRSVCEKEIFPERKSFAEKFLYPSGVLKTERVTREKFRGYMKYELGPTELSSKTGDTENKIYVIRAACNEIDARSMSRPLQCIWATPKIYKSC